MVTNDKGAYTNTKTDNEEEENRRPSLQLETCETFQVTIGKVCVTTSRKVTLYKANIG